MAIAEEPSKSYLIISVLCAPSISLDDIRNKLIEHFGDEDIVTDEFGFEHTSYYEKEMGANLKRVFISYKRLCPRGVLADCKNKTNEIELNWLDANGKRQVNLDPGFVNRENLIIATAKNFSNRIYLRDGIYGNLELLYFKKTWKTMPWTYPDYGSEEFLKHLTKFRQRLIDIDKENIN